MQECALSDRLREILAQDVDTTRNFERNYLQARLSPNWQDSLVLFGASKLGVRALVGLRRLGIQPMAFVDNDGAKWNSTLCGLAILSPSAALAKFGSDISFIVCVWRSKPVMQQLAAAGCKSAVEFKALFWHFFDEFLPNMRVDRPHLLLQDAAAVTAAFRSLSDETSKAEFLNQINWLLQYEFGRLEATNSRQQYFENDLFDQHANEVFVDCGAYDGDTIREYLSRYRWPEEIHAFEPDPDSRCKLTRWHQDQEESLWKRIVIHPYAASSGDGCLKFSADGVGSAVDGRGSMQVEARRLDEVLHDKTATFVKMDIEGGEPDAIQGAAQLIARARPVLAVCVYHRQAHIYSIPNQLRSIVDGYKYFIRRYGDEFGDIVCYAVPEERATGSRKNV